MDRHFIKEKLTDGIISVPFVKSEDQLADILTKGSIKSSFIFHTCQVGHPRYLCTNLRGSVDVCIAKDSLTFVLAVN